MIGNLYIVGLFNLSLSHPASKAKDMFFLALFKVFKLSKCIRGMSVVYADLNIIENPTNSSLPFISLILFENLKIFIM